MQTLLSLLEIFGSIVEVGRESGSRDVKGGQTATWVRGVIRESGGTVGIMASVGVGKLKQMTKFSDEINPIQFPLSQSLYNQL